ncbi:MAG: hypothetical protein ABI840_07915 [bacterium]
MKTIEFSSKVKNGAVKIPDNGNELENNEVKVILMWKGREDKNYDSKKIISLMSEIKEKNIFQNIKNPKLWQKSMRNEWK